MFTNLSPVVGEGSARENAAIDRLLAAYRPAAPERERRRIGRELFRQVHAELESALPSGAG